MKHAQTYTELRDIERRACNRSIATFALVTIIVAVGALVTLYRTHMPA